MQKFKYYSFKCFEEDLETMLEPLGADGWRLHTCEPFMTTGAEGSGPLEVFCVLDKCYVDEDPHMEEESDSGIKAMAMKS